MRPIALPKDHVRRIVERNATALVLTRRLPLSTRQPNLVEIHNAKVVAQNARRRREGRGWMQEDPHVITAEILTVTRMRFGEIDQHTAITAGYRTTDELTEDWKRRRHGAIDPALRVFVYRFQPMEARYLAERSQHGYTTDPALAVRGEPEAISEAAQEQISREARERWDAEHEAEIRHRHARNLSARVREAVSRADEEAIARLHKELGELISDRAA